LYRTLTPKEKGIHTIGQIFWIPAFCTQKSYFVLRINAWDRTRPVAGALFDVKKASVKEVNGFVSPFGELPIPELRLRKNEDLIVSKVKRRPAVLIVREGFNMRNFASFIDGVAKEPEPSRHVFAPIYSLKKEGNTDKDYPASFVERVKVADFPGLIYLPPHNQVIKNESMVVLSELQVHCAQSVGETNLALDQETFGIFLDDFLRDLIDKTLAG